LSAFAEKLEQATSAIALDQAEIARMLGTDRRTVARWLRGETESQPGAQARLPALIAVLELLSGVLKPAAAREWLVTPNRTLDHHKPVDLLSERQYRRVLGAIDAIAEGVQA
jgi:putative toxin-antitoxin system antitoxin component (TIGR02293 family)